MWLNGSMTWFKLTFNQEMYDKKFSFNLNIIEYKSGNFNFSNDDYK